MESRWTAHANRRLIYQKHTSELFVLGGKKKFFRLSRFFFPIAWWSRIKMTQQPSLAPCLPSPHPLPCQQQPQRLQVFLPCIGGVFLGTEPCFRSAYQQPLRAPPTNLADMVLSFRTPQAVAAVPHSQPDLHACPPPPPPMFDLCPTDPAQPLLLFYFYLRHKFGGFYGYLASPAETLPPSGEYCCNAEAWTVLHRDLCAINPSPPEITSAHMFCATSVFALLQQCVRQTRKNKQCILCQGGTPSSSYPTQTPQ